MKNQETTKASSYVSEIDRVGSVCIIVIMMISFCIHFTVVRSRIIIGQSFYEKRLIRKRRNLKKRPQKKEEETEKNRQPTLKGAVLSALGDTNRGEDGRHLEEFGVGEGPARPAFSYLASSSGSSVLCSPVLVRSSKEATANTWRKIKSRTRST